MRMYEVDSQATMVLVGAREAEKQGLVYVRGDGSPDDSGIKLTDAGALLAASLGYDPADDSGVRAVIHEAARDALRHIELYAVSLEQQASELDAKVAELRTTKNQLVRKKGRMERQIDGALDRANAVR